MRGGVTLYSRVAYLCILLIRMKICAVLGIFLLFASLSAGGNEETKAVVYSEDSFRLGLADNNFVMFYSPKCPKSQELKPVWEKLSLEFNTDDSNVIIATVDCTRETALCSEHDVLGYPTLKFFKAGHETGQKYAGTRTLESLRKFIQEEVEKEEDVEVPKVPAPLNTLKELNHANFQDFISKGKHFVKMYIPNCIHCKKLAPVWNELAETFQHVSDVRFSQINCDLNERVCSFRSEKGYPQMLWYENGKLVAEYTGSRTHEALKSFVLELLLNSDDPEQGFEPPSEENPVILLSGDNFENAIAKGVSLVKFYAPWCGFCKRIAPTWNDLAIKFLSNTNVKIGKVDCTLSENKGLCAQEKIDGYPTIFLYKNGERIGEYRGNRKVEDFYNFVIDHLDGDEKLGDHDEL